MEITGIKRDVVLLGLIRASSIVVTLSSVVLLSRVLGPTEYGRLSTVLAIIPLLCIPGSGGIGPLVLRGVAGYWGKNAPRLFGLLRFASIWVGGISLATVALAAIVWKSGFSIGTQDISWVLLAGGALVVLKGYLAFVASALQGVHKVVQSQLVEQFVVPATALIIYAVLTLSRHLDLGSALAGQALSVLIGLAIMFYGLSTYLKSQPSALPDYALGEWLPSLKRFAILAALSIVFSQQPVLLTSLLASAEEVGYLKIAISAGLVISLPLLVTNQAITPRLTVAANENDRLQMKRLSKKAARFSLLLALPAGVMLMVFSREVIGSVFGVAYLDGGGGVLSIIVIGQLVNVACGPVVLILNMSGKEKSTLVWMFVSLCLTTVASILLIPGYGAIGAALAASFGVILWNLLLLWEVKRQFGFSAAAL